MSEIGWSNIEENVAKEAFDKAYQREIATLIEEVRAKASNLAEINDMWILHDFLSARRHDIDGKYEYRNSVLIFVFSRLVKEGWLNINELEGLDKDKLAKIAALARM
jgi:hypothetical protein